MNSSSSAIMSEDVADNVTLNFGEEHDSPKPKIFRQYVAIFFHLVFRVLALITYLLCGLLSSSGFISSFIAIILLLSLDFWTTKNITGRLLAGLRWWNYVDEEGKSNWVFESRKGAAAQTAVLGAESRIFWLGLIASQVLWFIFAFVAIFSLSLKWLIVSSVGATLNGANLYGYVRCKMGSTKNISSAATNFLGKQVLGQMLSGMSKETPTQAKQ